MKEVKSVFGVAIMELVKRSKRYNLLLWSLYTVDILAVFGFTAYMFYHQITYQWYGYALVFVCMLVNMVVYYKLDTDGHLAYKFYKKHIRCAVTEYRFRVGWPDMTEVLRLCCIKYGPDDNMSVLKSLVQSACLKNVNMSKKFIKHMMQFKHEDGLVRCLVLEAGTKKYFIDFIEEGNDEYHHEGTVAEPDSGDEPERGSAD